VRAEVTSMQRASDFENVLSVVSSELEVVGLAFEACSIDVLDEPVSVHVKVVVVCSDHAAYLAAVWRVSGLSRTIWIGVQFRVLLAQRSGCRWLAAW
jgi:hypothetical protein